MNKSPAPFLPACPHCAQALKRVHRTPRDRLIGVFASVRRYRCVAPACGWTGLQRHVRSPRAEPVDQAARYSSPVLDAADAACSKLEVQLKPR